MLSDTAKTLIRTFPLGFVATVDRDGNPAVSPKGTFLVLDDSTIAFADIRSPGTLENLARHSGTEVNFIDVFVRKGLRVKGAADIVARDDERFDGLYPGWAAVWPDLAPRIRSIVLISVERALPVTTPPYDDGATEEEMIALYRMKFADLYPE